ncbi:dimethyl sulfoxide reductase DmsA precursor [Peptococcaceae bacterium CEB3]|nr:dimethyl sulfoxide reductase DmsA precursor [Peptococcaceae bacterium CEB3]
MEIRYSVCPHDCPDTCAWQVELEGGKVVRVKGDPTHPVTQGVICAKARHYPERLYGKDRVLYPRRRSGPKGSGRFERVGWEEALAEIAARWRALVAESGAQCILPFSYAGTEGIISNAGMDRRFFNRLGATQLRRTICSVAGSEGYKLVYGEMRGVDPLASVKARVMIFWGINALETNLHQALLADRARKQGARIIAVDVHRNKTADWADDFYHILPGSDGALALGLAHVILRDGLADLSWAGRNTCGLDEFKTQAGQYSPQRVAGLTGLRPGQVVKLAHDYAENRPSFIRLGNGLQHHDNGGMNTWAIALLPTLTGAWQDVGGGVLKSNSAYFPLDRQALERPDLRSGQPRSVNMIQLGEVLTELEPPIRSLYIYNSNPAAVVPDQNRVRQGLAREDLFTVVHEQVWTDTARWADIVLPATTSLEHQDLYVSYWHTVIQWAEPVIPAQGESLPNIEVFRRLAGAMGFTDPCFQDSGEEMARQALSLPYWREQGITLERIRQERQVALKIPVLPFGEGGFATPSSRAELRSEKAVELGLPPLPVHRPLLEGPETVGSCPLTLISPPNHHFLNSTFTEIEALTEGAGEPRLEIHPRDAAARGILEGDPVKVFNDRGECSLKAKVLDSVLPGVVVASGVWPGRAYPGERGINALTPAREADLAGGAVFFSTLVEVEKR